MTVMPIPAVMVLNEAACIPEAGFRESRLTVTPTSDHKLRTAWPAETELPDRAPWRRNEMRRVGFRIDSKPFSDYVACWQPLLYACRDGRIIGELRLVDARNSARCGGKRSDPEICADSPDRYPENETLHPGDS